MRSPKVTRWENVAGYAVRQGGLLWDDEKGNLAGEVRLANIPFADALVLAIGRRLPGKDYARMAPGEGPHGGVFAVTARTRTPGTFKYGQQLAAGIGMLMLLAFVGNFVMRSLNDMRRPEPEQPVTVTAATIDAKPTTSASPVIILAPSAKPSASAAAPPSKPKPKSTSKRKAH